MKKSNLTRYKTWVEIDAVSLKRNFSALAKQLSTRVTPICIVKSNAYGHGLIAAASILQSSAVFFGVDSIDEALELKKAGIKNPILILGYVPPSMLAYVAQNSFRLCVYDISVLKELVRLSKHMHKKVFVHIKIETGTHRQGVMPEDLRAFAKVLKKSEPYILVEGAYTHFADTENVQSLYYQEQLSAFQSGVKIFEEESVRPAYLHAAASAAVLLYPESYFNMARLGVALYGMYPSADVADTIKKRAALKPALTWKTRIAQVKTIPAGKTIGYDRAYKAEKKVKIAIIPVGYWDGYDRGLSNKGMVLIRGTKCSVVGNICMNMCMVDVTRVPQARAGEEAVLLGKQKKEHITAEQIAAQINTINYEVVTRINPLIPRVIV